MRARMVRVARSPWPNSMSVILRSGFICPFMHSLSDELICNDFWQKFTPRLFSASDSLFSPEDDYMHSMRDAICNIQGPGPFIASCILFISQEKIVSTVPPP